MFEESDLIQHAAKAFGDRLIADRMSLAVAEADEEMKPILNLINTLYLATIMEKNISWFVISGILKVGFLKLYKKKYDNKIFQNEDINQMKSVSADLCAQLGPQVTDPQREVRIVLKNCRPWLSARVLASQTPCFLLPLVNIF